MIGFENVCVPSVHNSYTLLQMNISKVNLKESVRQTRKAQSPELEAIKNIRLANF